MYIPSVITHNYFPSGSFAVTSQSLFGKFATVISLAYLSASTEVSKNGSMIRFHINSIGHSEIDNTVNSKVIFSACPFPSAQIINSKLF